MIGLPRPDSRAGLWNRLGAVFLIWVVALALGPKPAEGQVLVAWLLGEKLTTENFNVGIDIGMNFSTLSGLENAERINGTLFGLFAEWRFHPRFHLQPGLLVLSKKGAQEIDPIGFEDVELDPLVSGGTMTRNLDFLDIPILLQYAAGTDQGLRVGAGPQLNILLGGLDRYEGLTSEGTRVIIEEDVKDQLETLEVGIALDVEYQLAFGIAIGVRYFHGLTDMDGGTGFTSKSRVLSGSGRISLGKKAEGEE
ncbi:MAG: PorT family protein [Gemmatimonadetes bacterium]|nr:PorT family protein [Gemmatimonadota bacterium]